jgi:hypothetical protein
MKLQTDLIELMHAEMMKRILVPMDEDLPDPGVNFQAFVDGLQAAVRRRAEAVPRAELRDWYVDQALAMQGWCAKNRAPSVVRERVDAWLRRLLR